MEQKLRGTEVTNTTEIVQFLMDFAPRSQPLSLRYFAALEIDADQVSKLVHQGWLRQLSEDAYLLRGDQPGVDGTIAYLRSYIPELHVGGRTALEWHRIVHNLRFRDRVDLWGSGSRDMPKWAVERLACSYYSHSLFDDGMKQGEGLKPLAWRHPHVLVSVPERAILEYVSVSLELDLIDGVRDLIGSLRNIRLNVLQALVDCCSRRDVVWGLKFLAEDEGLEWAMHLRA
ncbi:MAG: type IV toxin-antitoxin system AbiEi family antitoxin domain-containing protein [Paraburkholderia sp.]|uniref:type IV toxin-antitoxin system AbiEi family antitoxin domain-containing protein n=1 Tax=Burkholderiaceae TaxID=119060 RepID=UPI00201798EA|nr:type IV toxin-antitoxin system AbiEi family antitoxin domain-containing protein [Burkholderia sp. 4M9327F10]